MVAARVVCGDSGAEGEKSGGGFWRNLDDIGSKDRGVWGTGEDMAIRKGGSWDSAVMIKEEEERRQWEKVEAGEINRTDGCLVNPRSQVGVMVRFSLGPHLCRAS